MKNLKFKLISNNTELINTSTSYFTTNNCIKFKIDDVLYEYDLETDSFFKKDKDLIIRINSFAKQIEIELVKEGYKFAMNIDNLTINKNNNSIKFTYTFYADEETTNCIYINY